MEIAEIAQAINDQAIGFKIAALQDWRKQQNGLLKSPTHEIFGKRSIFPDKHYAFHTGGRREIQFNIGIEKEKRYLRHGVAFSLERSQSLPDIDLLLPKIKKFNDYIEAAGNEFADMKMRHSGSGRYSVRQVPPKLFRQGNFIFMGKWQSLNRADIKLILRDFDRLMPLYEFVEGSEEMRIFQDQGEGNVHEFVPGRSVKKSKSIMTLAERTLDVILRHNHIQRGVHEHLAKVHGENYVRDEHPTIGGRKIDVAVKTAGYLNFYEIKTSSSLRNCIREAVGQLLEYSFWPGSQQATKLVVVTENECDTESRKYLKSLREGFKIPIYHQRYDERKSSLGKET